MILKTKGIVFRFTRYRETSIIITIFTELFGLQSYIVNGVRSKTSGGKMALYQPLTFLELVVYHREGANILRIKEAKCYYPYRKIHNDITRETLALFLVEILNKSIKEQSHVNEIFLFIEHSMILLDTVDGGLENFHLVFLIKLSRLLGFGPQIPNEILEGRLIDGVIKDLLTKLLASDYQTNLPMSNSQRRELLDILLRFYSSHIDHFGEMKSVAVLREILLAS